MPSIFLIKNVGDSFVELVEGLQHESTGYPKGALSYWDMLMINPTPSLLPHGTTAQKDGSYRERRVETHGERNGRKERERRRKGYDNQFGASTPPQRKPENGPIHDERCPVCLGRLSANGIPT